MRDIGPIRVLIGHIPTLGPGLRGRGEVVDQVFVKMPQLPKELGVRSVTPLGDGAVGCLDKYVVALPRTPCSSIKHEA